MKSLEDSPERHCSTIIGNQQSPVCISDFATLDCSSHERKFKNTSENPLVPVQRRQIFPRFTSSGRRVPYLEVDHDTNDRHQNILHGISGNEQEGNSAAYIGSASRNISNFQTQNSVPVECNSLFIKQDTFTNKFERLEQKTNAPDDSGFILGRELVGPHRFLPKTAPSSCLADLVQSEESCIQDDSTSSESKSEPSDFCCCSDREIDKLKLSETPDLPNQADKLHYFKHICCGSVDQCGEYWGHFDDAFSKNENGAIHPKRIARKKYFTLDVILEEKF